MTRHRFASAAAAFSLALATFSFAGVASAEQKVAVVDVQRAELELTSHELGAAATFSGAVPLSRAGGFGYNVRVVPRHPLLANPAELGLISVAS